MNRLWGAERIRRELLKVGLSVATHTLQTCIARVRSDQPTSHTWATFLKHHANSIWTCDFARDRPLDPPPLFRRRGGFTASNS